MQRSGFQIQKRQPASQRSRSVQLPSKRSRARWRFPVQDRFCFRAIGIGAGPKRNSGPCGRKRFDVPRSPHFRIYDLRSTYATWLSAGGVADEWVTQMLRQSDAQVFKKYSQMKLQMKREHSRSSTVGRTKWTRPREQPCWRPHCARSRCNSLVCAQFVHSHGFLRTSYSQFGLEQSWKVP
jgi:hypothetical protein